MSQPRILVASEEGLKAAIRKQKASGGLRRTPKPRTQPHPRGCERAYLAGIRKIIRKIREGVRDLVIPRLEGVVSGTDPTLRQDAISDDMRIAFETFDLQIGEQLPELAAETAGAAAGAVAADNARSAARQFNSLGVDLYTEEPFIADMLESFTLANESAITGIASRMISDVRKTVLEGINDGKRHEEIANILRHQLSARGFKDRKPGETIGDIIRRADRQARLLARDQVASFNGRLNSARQQRLGVKRYVWRTVGDNRVREEHEQRDGQVFSWDSPPPDGHPGMPINCRCTAEPVLGDLVEGLDDG